MTRDPYRVDAALAARWSIHEPRECIDCGQENPARAPCCGVCGGELEDPE